MIKGIIIFLIRMVISMALVTFIVHFLLQDECSDFCANGIIVVIVAFVWWGTEKIKKKFFC